MAIDPEQFRQALSQFASGVTVVTTLDKRARPQGLTVSSFASVSLIPPLVAICVDDRAEAQDAIRESGRFAVSILAEGQEAISRLFAYGGDEKFEAPFLVGPLGLPLVPGAVAHLVCLVKAAYPSGDHVLFVGEIEGAEIHPGRPLVYHRGAYHRLLGEQT